MTCIRTVLQATSLAWLALQLAGCGDVTAPTPGKGPNVLDEKSPFPPQARVPACSGADHDAAVAVWTKLRNEDYPYHLQTVALSPAFPSGCRALIIAEPPPTVSLAALRDLAPELLTSAETRQHGVGYDGWTRDVVVTLPPVEDAQLTELIAGLHGAMFGTTYRAKALDTSEPVPHYDPRSAPLDVGIGPGELHRWLLQEPTGFTHLGGGEPVSFKDLMASGEPEVYLDDAHGLIVWTVPRRADVAEMADLFRQFTLESDILVGAIASSTTVAIIARQRVIDPRILQPLRFETVSLLAAVHDKDSLHQSYERTNPLAGRIDETRDWAPIFLSPELLDTEYGSVLDIADQFLKSWSNNGKTEYINFKYPPPRTWAFPAPVFIVAKAQQFRYNWNTTNVGAVVNVEGVDVFWLRRTGALNVSYFPDEDELAEHRPAKQPKVQNLEETAYQFFVKTQTPILARVVQYNTLFQIFARFGIGSSMTVPTTRPGGPPETLAVAARKALTTIRGATDAEIKQRLEKLLRTQMKYLQKQILDRMRALQAQLPPEMLRGLSVSQYASDIEANARVRMSAELAALSQKLGGLTANELTELSVLIGDPRGVKQVRQDLFEIYRQVRELGSAFRLFASPDVYKTYAESATARRDVWIHTPSIVISWNQPPIEGGIGGHNLDAKVAAVTFHPERPVIAVEQIAKRVPVDAVGAKELPRLELGPSGPRLAAAPVNRASRSALGSTRQRGFWSAPAQRVKPGRGGSQEAVVAKLSDGYRVVDASGAVHEVTTMPEVVELIGNARGVRGKHATIRFEGLRPEEVRHVLRVAETNMRARVAGVLKSAPEFAKKPLDFRKATLLETQTRTYSDGAGEIGHVIHIPADKPISIEVKVALREGSPGAIRTFGSKIWNAIKSLIARLSGKSMTAQEFGLELRKELRDLLRDQLPRQLHGGISDDLLRELFRLEIKMRQEAVDFTIVQRELPGHGTRDLAG